MDKKIEALVAILNNLKGVQTFCSCQGHEDGIAGNGVSGYRFPYILFECSPSIVEEFRKCLASTSTKYTWKISSHKASKEAFLLTVKKSSSFQLPPAWKDIAYIANAFATISWRGRNDRS